MKTSELLTVVPAKVKDGLGQIFLDNQESIYGRARNFIMARGMLWSETGSGGSSVRVKARSHLHHTEWEMMEMIETVDMGRSPEQIQMEFGDAFLFLMHALHMADFPPKTVLDCVAGIDLKESIFGSNKFMGENAEMALILSLIKLDQSLGYRGEFDDLHAMKNPQTVQLIGETVFLVGAYAEANGWDIERTVSDALDRAERYYPWQMFLNSSSGGIFEDADSAIACCRLLRKYGPPEATEHTYLEMLADTDWQETLVNTYHREDFAAMLGGKVYGFLVEIGGRETGVTPKDRWEIHRILGSRPRMN